jgi:hypothetical protein
VRETNHWASLGFNRILKGPHASDHVPVVATVLRAGSHGLEL